jgi:hypothetical protein
VALFKDDDTNVVLCEPVLSSQVAFDEYGPIGISWAATTAGAVKVTSNTGATSKF